MEHKLSKEEWAQWKRLREIFSGNARYGFKIEEMVPRLIEEYHLDLLQENKSIEALQQRYGIHAKEAFELENLYLMQDYQWYQKATELVKRKQNPSRYHIPAVYQYLQRVENRLKLESTELRKHENVHYYPVVFELGEGCKRQCKFCGIDAPVWKSNYLYTEENAMFWREMLQGLFQLFGPMLDMVPCYFATEPFDNPDYEKFLKDFYDIVGGYPQTTTAAADVYPNRVRNYLQQIGEDCQKEGGLRISVVSLEQWERVLKEFTSLELQHVEMVLNQMESEAVYSLSGRVRKNREQFPPHKVWNDYSISCIAGFRINLSNKTICFMEPELPSDDTPNGYEEYVISHFDSVEELLAQVKHMMRCYMTKDLPIDVPLYWNPKIQINRENNLIVFCCNGKSVKITKSFIFTEIIEAVKKGSSLKDFCEENNYSVFSLDELHKKLNILFQKGYLRYKYEK